TCDDVTSEVRCAAQAARAVQSTASSGTGQIGSGSGRRGEASLLLAVVANGRVLKQI
ncbi:hypothetical protein TcasGA2_TC007988, partial [Tribolium castaneum]